MPKPLVFVSYSHKDEVWKEQLLSHLGALVMADRVRVWVDRKIDGGDQWYDEIAQAMEAAAVAVCLISPDFLRSNFCMKEEVPYLLQRRATDGMVLLPVLVRPSSWELFPWLKKTQMIPLDGKSVSEDFNGKEDGVFKKVATRVLKAVETPGVRAVPAPAPTWPPPDSIDIDRLPATGAELFARRNELQMLDKAWDSGGTNVVSLVAQGGVGKSTLVNKWLESLAAESYRGARRVFGWSFYSQGTGERVTSADIFIASALEWFGDPDPKKGSPWDKGQRLAGLVRAQRTLLVLDGMEPLQSHHRLEKGKIQDPALAVLVKELARANPGLCVITTREEVPDLSPFRKAVENVDLDQISAQAGRALLRVARIRGSDAELEAAAREFGPHALALNLLAAYLHDIPGKHVSNAAEIPHLDIPVKQGRHARRVMAAFAERFGDSPELDVLKMLGLFDRPADESPLRAIRAKPAIAGLTTHVARLSRAKWRAALDELRRCKLIARQREHYPGVVDAHPLIREHFGEKLQAENPDGWKQAHSRLYEHYKHQAPDKPDTIEQMAPLFAAVAHGCQAGRFQEALDEVYWARIQRGKEAFSTHKLGALGADLAALSGFFVTPWTQPIAELTEAARSFLLGEAGFYLRALGRLAEAAEPMQAGLQADLRYGGWENGARQAGNLSELYLTLGDLGKAQQYAQQSVDLADKGGEAFEKMVMGTALADALHQAGRISQALDLFEQAEKMQKDHQPEFPLLYSLQGFQYCDVLLSQGRYEEVHTRAEKLFEWRLPSDPLLDTALDYLSLGRACLLQGEAGRADAFAPAAGYLNQAVDGLRQAGSQHHIPRGLLTRASLYRLTGDFDRARADLDEAAEIAARGQMTLHQADCHLESARLHLAAGKNELARRSFDEAAAIINDMGYHRRDPEVRLVQARLLLAEGDKPAARAALAAATKMIDDMGLHRWDLAAQQLDKAIG